MQRLAECCATSVSTQISQAFRAHRRLRSDLVKPLMCCCGVMPASEVKDRLRTLVSRIPGAATELTARLDKLTEDLEDAPPERIVELERIIWPGKISGTNIPSYIVPIRPHWSTDLFDGRLATGRLWAADTELVLNPDSVYYRAQLLGFSRSVVEFCGMSAKGRPPGEKCCGPAQA